MRMTGWDPSKKADLKLESREGNSPKVVIKEKRDVRWMKEGGDWGLWEGSTRLRGCVYSVGGKKVGRKPED